MLAKKLGPWELSGTEAEVADVCIAFAFIQLVYVVDTWINKRF